MMCVSIGQLVIVIDVDVDAIAYVIEAQMMVSVGKLEK